jgi:four helix bundle protein
MHNFRELKIWKDSIGLAKTIYNTCSKFPSYEKYGLVSQLQRATVSIAANIAEGSGRNSKDDFKRFLNIATGSAYEVETLLCIAKEVEYLNDEQFNLLCDEIQRIEKMIYNFNQQLK